MKVLIATTYIYKNEWPEFTKNRTGFGIMVNDIFESISKKVDTYLLTQVITKGHGKVLKHTWGDVIGNASIKDFGRGFRYFIDYHQSVKDRIKYFYYALNGGTLRRTIRSIKPDLVQIHGIGTQLKPFIEICEEEHIPYVVTLHGLIGLDETVQAKPWSKQFEKDFLIEADRKGIPVTVISTGMKRRIENNYLGHEANNITVVCNGTRIPFDEKLIGLEKLDLRQEFGLTDEKILVVMGTLCERKNQIQIIRAMKMVKTPCHLFLCGGDASNSAVQKAVDDERLNDRIHLLGFLPHEKVEQVLDQADLNIVASKDEGFGLSIIEAYGHGIPTVAFADLEAVPELFDERAMVSVEERSDEALAFGIENGLKRAWEKVWIREYSKSFSMEKLAEQYKEEYSEAMTRGSFISIAKTYDYLAIRRILGYKVLAYIGNYTDNKNQIELVRLMSELKDNKILAVLVGREMDDGRVRKYVIDNRLENVVLAGFTSEMDSVWLHTDLNVFLSKNDGFGLSIIEGYMRGIPSIMYDDLDAVEDVRSDGLNLIPRDFSKLQKAIISIVNEKNRNSLFEISKQYSTTYMTKKYLDVFKKIITAR